MQPETPRLPPDVHAEIRQTAHFGKATRVRDLVADAADRYEDGEYEASVDLARQAKPMAPRSPAVRQVLGLALYALGRWRESAGELAAYHRMSDRRDLEHLRADCERALGRPEKALEILDGIKLSDVGDEETLVEGIVIAAGALRDLGRTGEAIALLRRGPVDPALVHEYHLRLWYALADALEEAGERVEARDWWDLVHAQDPEFFDVERRRLRRT